MAGDDRAAAEQVGIEIDGDDKPRAESARGRDRHRIDQRSIDQPASTDQHWRKNSRQGVGGTQRFAQSSACQPDFMTGVEFGGDRGKADRQIVNARVLESRF